MALEALIFDVDGTLSETEELHRTAFNEAFVEFGLRYEWDQPLYRELLKVTGGKERFRHYVRKHDGDRAEADDFESLIKKVHARKTEIYTAGVRAGRVELRPGVREVIEKAPEQGFRLAIATTTSYPNVEALVQSVFGPKGLERFDAIGAGDQVPKKKPAPDVFLKALKDLGLSPSVCVAFEDSRNGLLSARAAELATVVTPSIYTNEQDFSEAALVTDSMESLLPDLRASLEPLLG